MESTAVQKIGRITLQDLGLAKTARSSHCDALRSLRTDRARRSPSNSHMLEGQCRCALAERQFDGQWPLDESVDGQTRSSRLRQFSTKMGSTGPRALSWDDIQDFSDAANRAVQRISTQLSFYTSFSAPSAAAGQSTEAASKTESDYSWRSVISFAPVSRQPCH